MNFLSCVQFLVGKISESYKFCHSMKQQTFFPYTDNMSFHRFLRSDLKFCPSEVFCKLEKVWRA